LNGDRGDGLVQQVVTDNRLAFVVIESAHGHDQCDVLDIRLRLNVATPNPGERLSSPLQSAPARTRQVVRHRPDPGLGIVVTAHLCPPGKTPAESFLDQVFGLGDIACKGGNLDHQSSLGARVQLLQPRDVGPEYQGREGRYFVSFDSHNTPHAPDRFSACPIFFPDSLGLAMTDMKDQGHDPGNDATHDQDARFYFRQLLSGRDFAREDPLARQMVNFCYLIGDRDSGEAVVVDPAYDVSGLLDVLAEDGMRLSGVLVSHAHPDHVGGAMMGYSIEGLSDLLERVNVPVHVQRDEAHWVTRATGVGESDLVEHASADVVKVGDLEIELVHTPGHTPGSQCFSVAGRLVSGDTLFLEGCGRTDLPGGDPEQMYESISTRLARFGDDTILYPGHFYAAEPSATLGDTRLNNYVFRPRSVEQWLSMFGS
jgi:glyoxylase-like metal-dependent hydrolase (beta-lactamase superfamily II)